MVLVAETRSFDYADVLKAMEVAQPYMESSWKKALRV